MVRIVKSFGCTLLMMVAMWSAFALNSAALNSAALNSTALNSTILTRTLDAAIVVNTTEDELNNDGDCSLREAIEAANTDQITDACNAGNGRDTILLSAGIYSLSLTGAYEDANLTGDLDIRSDLILSGTGVADTLIHGNQLDRVLHIHQAATVEVNGITLLDGLLPSEPYPSPEEEWALSGGGLLNVGELTLSNCVITNNSAGNEAATAGVRDGGGIANVGTLIISDCIVQRNQAGPGSVTLSGQGGGIANWGTLHAYHTLIINNISGAGTFSKCVGNGGAGGGISNQGDLALTHSTVCANLTADGSIGGHGGGIYNSGQITITYSTVDHNITGDGSYIESDEGYYPCISYGGDGGGIYNDGVLTIFNSTISKNHTGDGNPTQSMGGGGDGGGIFNNGSVTAANSTIALNQTGSGWESITPNGKGGGIYHSGADVTIKSVLLAANAATNEGPDDCKGTISSLGYNLIEEIDGCSLAGEQSGNITGLSPYLGPLTSNGGDTWTHALLYRSPAVDAGSCTDIKQLPVTNDQRGDLRPQVNNCDIGSYEATPFDSIYRFYLPID